MSLQNTSRPAWLTCDCHGTLIRWDEGLMEAVREILRARPAGGVDAAQFLAVFDRHEHALECVAPYRLFRDVAGGALRLALAELGLPAGAAGPVAPAA